jgi:nucleoside-diphosphate-sugar epimerase
MDHDRMSPNVIIGCGYLGRRVAALWLNQGKRVIALTRNRSKELDRLGIEPIEGDILNPSTLDKLPQAATLLYAVGLDRRAGNSFRDIHIEGLRNVLQTAPRPHQFIYISSTSIYAQSQGEEVDESSLTEPVEENGKIIRSAEVLLRSEAPSANILRFAGIYGPDRIIRRAAIEKGEPLVGDADKWLNLIHVEDGAQAVLAAEERAAAGETYLIADDCPVRRRDFYTFAAELLGAPAATFEPWPSGSPSSPHERANRRIVNHKMRSQLGVELKYPDYKSGLRALLTKQS